MLISLEFDDVLYDLQSLADEYCKGELLPGALGFYQELIDTFGENNIQIVTNSCPDVVIAKTQMIRNFGINCLIIHDKDKYKHTSGTILIDNYYINIQEHINKTDGCGILANINKSQYVEIDYLKIKHAFANKVTGICKYIESYDAILSELKKYFNSEICKVYSVTKTNNLYETICMKEMSQRMIIITSEAAPTLSEYGSEYSFSLLLEQIGHANIVSLSNHPIGAVITDNMFGLAVTYDSDKFPSFVENYLKSRDKHLREFSIENIIRKANQAGIYCKSRELKPYDVDYGQQIYSNDQFIYTNVDAQYVKTFDTLYKLDVGYIGIKDGKIITAHIVNSAYAFDFDSELCCVKLGRLKSRSIHKLNEMQRIHNYIVDINLLTEEVSKSSILNLIGGSFNHEYTINSFEKDKSLRAAQNGRNINENVESNDDCENEQCEFSSTSTPTPDSEPNKKVVCTIEYSFLIDPSQKDRIFNELNEAVDSSQFNSQFNNIPVPPGGLDISLKFDGKFLKGLKIDNLNEGENEDEAAVGKSNSVKIFKDANSRLMDFHNALMQIKHYASRHSKANLEVETQSTLDYITKYYSRVLSKYEKEAMNEAAVGQRGKTSYKEAMDYCGENEDSHKSADALFLDKFKDTFQNMDYQENEKYGYYYHPEDRSRIDELLKYSAFQSRFFNVEFADCLHQNLTCLAEIHQVDQDCKLYYIKGFRK